MRYKGGFMLKPRIQWGCLLLLITVLFYWKILLTHQFSLLTESEGVNQGYSWYQFCVSSIKHGHLPLWDPYTYSGHSFLGEMQAGAYSPLNFLLALAPFNGSGVFSPQLYNWIFALAHFFAACFMFVLVREFGLSRFSALVAAVCFALGGFVGRVPWPNYLWGSIWLPVIFLFLIRALKTDGLRFTLLRASLAGLALGMAILAGGLHAAIMQTLVIVTALGFSAWYPMPCNTPRRKAWAYCAAVMGVIGLVAFAAGAVQLFPSMEFSRHSVRWLGAPGPLPTTEKIPYAYLRDGMAPQGVVTLLLFAAFDGNVGSVEMNPYLGAFPLLLAIIGVWKAWSNVWVRYLTGLAAGAVVFSLGSFSLLHGLLYSLAPFLWIAREAARSLYLADFALAILAAFGAEVLFSKAAESSDAWTGLNRILKWVAIACAVALCVPAVFTQVQIHVWNALSILLILCSCALFFYVSRGHTGSAARFFTLALILCDLSAFDWTARNKIDIAKNGTDHLDRLLSCRGAVDFLKSQTGLFRVQVIADSAPNIGDVFQIQATWGGGATVPMHYWDLVSGVPRAMDLLNVRYFMKPAAAPEPGAVYQDAAWKIYENPQAYPRGWLVHEVEVEPVPKSLLNRLGAQGTDLRRVALLSEPMDATPEPISADAPENVRFQSYEADNAELVVHAESRGLLVLSEIYYPGWQATVNDRTARIWEVDGALRGIVVGSGDNKVKLRYRPGSVLAGTLLTACAFLGIPLAWLIASRQQRRA
jgi:hypothetical protein